MTIIWDFHKELYFMRGCGISWGSRGGSRGNLMWISCGSRGDLAGISWESHTHRNIIFFMTYDVGNFLKIHILYAWMWDLMGISWRFSRESHGNFIHIEI